MEIMHPLEAVVDVAAAPVAENLTTKSARPASAAEHAADADVVNFII